MIAAVSGPNGPGVFVGDESGIDCCIVGTSLSAQIWSGISKLITQLNGKPLGPINPRIYALANAGLANSGFRDVTSGNNDFGTPGTPDFVPGFTANAGYDQATGWGTVDMGAFAKQYVAPPAPIITSVSSPVLVGTSFTINGNFFSPGAMVNFFVVSRVPPNAGPLPPSSVLPTRITVPVPATVSLGEGFVGVQVVNIVGKTFTGSNTVNALLQGYAPAGVPTLTHINGAPLAPTSGAPDFAPNNVQTVIMSGKSVTLSGSGFDAVHGVAVNVFCACPGGNAGPVSVNPGSGGLTSSSFSFTLPANVPTGPASLAVVNKGNFKSSNSVSVPVGAQIAITSITQLSNTITVNGRCFAPATVINFFNQQGLTTPNLGGIVGGAAVIPLHLINSNHFTFTKPAKALPGPSYVQAINPPFVPYTSSSGPTGGFTLH